MFQRTCGIIYTFTSYYTITPLRTWDVDGGRIDPLEQWSTISGKVPGLGSVLDN